MFDILVTCYLFLGGSGAGAFALLVIIGWLNPETDKSRNRWSKSISQAVNQTLEEVHLGRAMSRTLDVGYPVCLAMLLIGALCLTADLAAESGVTILFKNPTPSLITGGAFLLAALIAISAFFSAWRNMALLALPRIAARVSEAIGLVCAVGVMTYTGLLLASMGIGVPLWDTPLVPILFVLSSLSTGCGIVIACAISTGAFKAARLAVNRMLALDSILIACEAACAALLVTLALQDPAAAPAANRLVSGDLSVVFWGGFVLSGLIIPIMLKATIDRSGSVAQAIVATIALCLVVGGFSFRICVVDAGMHPNVNAEFLAIQLAENGPGEMAGEEVGY